MVDTSKTNNYCGLHLHVLVSISNMTTTTTITKPFVPSIWGRLHEPKENYAGSGTWISFLRSFLSSNMPSLRPLASISCHITSIHVFFGLPCALLTCPKLIRSTRRTDASVGLRRTWPNHRISNMNVHDKNGSNNNILGPFKINFQVANINNYP